MNNVLKIVPKSKYLKSITIGGNNPVFTIAEIGLNHNGNIDLAKELIDSASDAGCTSVKFQNFETEDVYIQGEKAGQYSLLGKKIDIYDLHKELEIEFNFLSELKDYAEKKGLYFFSAPMGKESLSTLLKLDCDLIKISSYEITNLPWVKEVAKTKKPIIMSCGGSDIGEVERALAQIYEYHNQVALMHCVIKYPASIEDANLNIINTLKSAFEVPVGFSNNGFIDNGVIDFKEIPYSASALGMDLYEIHITLDRQMEGVDQGFSTEPSELIDMIKIIQETRTEFLHSNRLPIKEKYLGSGVKRTLECERYVREFAYKSIFTTRALKKGEKLDLSNIKCLRPGEYRSGLAPLYFDLVCKNFYAKEKIEAYEPIAWTNITTL
jgi:sialic acid synthase SpsE